MQTLALTARSLRRHGFAGFPSALARDALPAVGALILSLAAGLALARGDLAGIVLAAGIGGLALAVVASELRLAALLAWVVLSPLAYPFLRWPATDALLTLDRVWVAALVGAVLLRRRPHGTCGASRLLAIAILWLAAAFLARALASPSLLASLQTWVDGILLPTIVYFAARETVRSDSDLRRLGGALAASGLALATIGLAQRAYGFELASLSGGTQRFDASIGLVRISGPYGFPEPYALALIVCLAGTLFWMQARRGAAIWIGGAIAAAEIAAASLTFFRAAWIGVLVVVATAAGLRLRRAARLAAIAGIVAMGALAGALAFGDSEVVRTRIGDSGNVYARLATYVSGLEIFRDAPLAGVGVGEFPNVQAAYGLSVSGIAGLEHAHSSYVNVLAEQGLAGFLPLALATVAGWLAIRRFRRLARRPIDLALAAAAGGAGIAYLVMSLTLTMLPYGQSNALLALLLGAVSSRLDGPERGAGGPAP